MLLRFEVANHRSIMGPVELSMIAVDADRPSVRRVDPFPEPVLTTAGIYGPNASGKSNLVEALAWLSNAVGRSLRAWDEYIPRDPFKFADGPTTPSTYEVEMVVGGVRYAYVAEVDDESVLFEGLYSYPERRRRVLFERNELDLQFRRGIGGVAGVRELLTPTTLALSAAVRLDEPEMTPFGRALTSIRVHGLRGRRGMHRGDTTLTRLLFEDEVPQPRSSRATEPGDGPTDARESALALLRFADLGIDNVKVTRESEDEVRVAADALRKGSRTALRFLHRVADQQLPFDLDDESAGTQTWFALIGPTLRTLRNGSVLLFDEIDASLHPRLSARLLELFQDPETNPRGAQLIFTTHDTSLLNHLNRDEVWLTERGTDGATTLTALAEYGSEKVRRSVNLEKAYLQGRFGAVPELDQYILRQALGLLENHG